LSENQPLTINGWRVFAHPLFISQLEQLSTEVENLRQKYPEDYQKKNSTKRLAAINKLAFEIIPQDPTRKEYRHGNTLGKEYKHWFRAKFFQQYRLFFRYHQQQQIIVYTWVNDAKTKRAYESKTDAYQVFKRMLEDGNPPDHWAMLLEQAENLTE
jgi:toxin YhaV